MSACLDIASFFVTIARRLSRNTCKVRKVRHFFGLFSLVNNQLLVDRRGQSGPSSPDYPVLNVLSLRNFLQQHHL